MSGTTTQQQAATQGQRTGDVFLMVNGQQLTGWETIRVTRGLDRTPSDFDISLSERFPTNPGQMSAQPGQTCQLMIDTDLVITGYVDRVMMTIASSSHTVRIMGRSKSEDIVDCDVTPDVLNGNGINSPSLLDLASRLCAPFGIGVKNLSTRSLSLPVGAGNQVQAILTESPWLIMERVARYLGVLLYDDTDGSLIIADVGATSMASGFDQGVNIQSASNSLSMDERYSVYIPSLMNVNLFGTDAAQATQGMADVMDPGVPRFRPKIIVSEQFQLGNSLAELRAQWEAARRAGRSQALQVTVDSWRDSAGTLWAPNAFAPINVPALKLVIANSQWVIGSVNFMRDASRGTTADIVMMPKAAFQPEPTILLPSLPNPSTPAAAAD